MRKSPAEKLIDQLTATEPQRMKSKEFELGTVWGELNIAKKLLLVLLNKDTDAERLQKIIGIVDGAGGIK